MDANQVGKRRGIGPNWCYYGDIRKNIDIGYGVNTFLASAYERCS